MKKQKKKTSVWQWVKCGVALVLLAAFLIWIRSWWGIIVAPFIFDSYITHKINWGWWRDLENSFMVTIMSWVDAIVFALVAVYFVNLYFFQNYTIPSSSLEKSLLVGDYLFVSKMSYGPRKPMTPLTMPLTQHTMPVFGCKSYIEWPQWDYERVSPKPIELNDIVVFNYPSGDTIVSNPRYQSQDFYGMCQQYGRYIFEQQYGALPMINSLPKAKQREQLNLYYSIGKQYVQANAMEYGEIQWRPVDRRENYVKRCVGLPGQTLQIKDKMIYLDGVANKQPDNVQFNYEVHLKQGRLPDTLCHRLGLANDDLANLYNYNYRQMPLTRQARAELEKAKDYVDYISEISQKDTECTYPLNGNMGWSLDNYGPIWIPKKGATLDISIDNIAVYERCITAYEGNTLAVDENGEIFINGEKATKYTFKMDYYWMMGDNRHCSADSRMWGFVPEDHIVGKPIMIWLSTDKDRGLFDGGIRWSRMFRWVENIK